MDECKCQIPKWFGTACCPANIARLVASLGNYIYAYSDNAVFVNLYVGSNTSFNLKNGVVGLKMETNYPWEGKVKINIDPVKKSAFSLQLRLPGWMYERIAPGGLYAVLQEGDDGVNDVFDPVVLINGKQINYTIKNGY
ncbi:MAG TPA: glycoside hydrolase family 127 protein, partial [Chitinophagales bacterium]|nr:glycoside hydrolase family 127 protein [Chitinophagales bacterium]